MQFDVSRYPYPSRRTVAFAGNGMVATSQNLAAQAGLSILKQGGNAIDAAIAAAACLTVVEPTSNGIGGDAFALVWHGGELYGLNASGPSPKTLTLELLIKQGYKEMPRFGWIPVNVPGLPAAWGELSERFGRLPLAELLKPAIEYAEMGFPVSPTVAKAWQTAYKRYAAVLKDNQFRSWFETFAPTGRAPQAGEFWRSPDHAKTLQIIAEEGWEDFYRGSLAEKIAAFSKRCGGYLSADDLAAYRPEWVEPVKIDYRGYEVWELPPNGHGLVVLMALNILKGFEFTERETAASYHRQIEAVKLAFADGKRYITDPAQMTVRVEDLLSEGYAHERRKLIGRSALTPEPGAPQQGGTVYLAAADTEGNMVSFIQSNYQGFGSGLVVPGTGISLHNRGKNFSLDPNHDNRFAPGKRPYHTIIPGFLTRQGKAVGPFGVMGAFMQPQGHVQVVMNTVDFNLNPQAALDAPRWQWTGDKTVELEHGVPAHIAEALAGMGHDIKWALGSEGFGRGQIIWRTASGALAGATEPRADGIVAAW